MLARRCLQSRALAHSAIVRIAHQRAGGTFSLSPVANRGRGLSTAVVETTTTTEDESDSAKSIGCWDHPQFQKVLTEKDAFDVASLVSVKQLFDARVHLGHKTTTLNPFMQPYLFGSRFDHLIIDLDQTKEHMIDALNFVGHIAYRDGIILFMTRHHQTAHKVEKVAQECQEFAHTRGWRKGLLTNSVNLFGSETRLPDCILLFSTTNCDDALVESSRMLIPTVGIVDTDSDPRFICYPVPGNDDSPSAVSLYCHLFKTVILRARERRKRDIAAGLL